MYGGTAFVGMLSGTGFVGTVLVIALSLGALTIAVGGGVAEYRRENERLNFVLRPV